MKDKTPKSECPFRHKVQGTPWCGVDNRLCDKKCYEEWQTLRINLRNEINP